jgi:hypothetical protein
MTSASRAWPARPSRPATPWPASAPAAPASPSSSNGNMRGPAPRPLPVGRWRPAPRQPPASAPGCRAHIPAAAGSQPRHGPGTEPTASLTGPAHRRQVAVSGAELGNAHRSRRWRSPADRRRSRHATRATRYGPGTRTSRRLPTCSGCASTPGNSPPVYAGRHGTHPGGPGDPEPGRPGSAPGNAGGTACTSLTTPLARPRHPIFPRPGGQHRTDILRSRTLKWLLAR